MLLENVSASVLSVVKGIISIIREGDSNKVDTAEKWLSIQFLPQKIDQKREIEWKSKGEDKKGRPHWVARQWESWLITLVNVYTSVSVSAM